MKRETERIVLSNGQMRDCNIPGTIAAELRGRAGGSGHVPKCSSVTTTHLSAPVPSGLALHNQT